MAVFPVAGYTGKVNFHHGQSAATGGSDLFAAEGTPVLSMTPGTVQWANSDSLGGHNVGVVGDDGLTYYYAHFKNAPRVQVGQRVAEGQQIGDVGRSGNAANTPPHLHIGIGHGIQTGGGAQGGVGKNFNAVEYLRSALTNAVPANYAAPPVGAVTSTAASTRAWGAAAPYIPQLMAAAANHSVPVNVLAGLLIQESGGNPRAVSKAGAQGLMQFMPGTARGLGIDPFNPDQAIDAGARYLKQMADQSGGDWETAVAKYNAGPAGNLNNAETRNHIVKVMGFADQIGGAMANMPPLLPGGGFPPGFPGAPPGGGGNRERQPSQRQTGPSPLAALWERLKALGIQLPEAVARAVTPPMTSDVVPPGQQSPGGFAPGAPGAPGAPPPPPGVPPPGGPMGGEDQPDPGIVTGGDVGGGAYPIAGGPAPPQQRPRPQGWTNPEIYEGANRTIVEIANDMLSDLEGIDKELSGLSETDPRDRQRRSQLEAQQNLLRQRIQGMAPQLAKIEEDRQGKAEGTVMPGVTPYMPKIPILRKVDGKWVVEYIDNPNPQTNPSIETANISGATQRDVAGIQGATSRDVANIQGATSRDVAGIQGQTSRDVANIQGQTSLGVAGINATTSRVTTALAQAVEQRRQDIDAQIRSGELSLREATEQFNQWYKTSVEAPLAILQNQRESARYQLEQSRGATERAAAQSTHERGVAQLGQQAWQGAANAYNTILPQTAAAGWNQQFQQNLQPGQSRPLPTLTPNESMEQFATRMTAQMLKDVSPFAASLAGAEQQMGVTGAPPTSEAMTNLTNQAIGQVSGAMAAPPQMPQLPDFKMPGQVDIAGMAGAGMGGGLTQQMQGYLPNYQYG